MERDLHELSETELAALLGAGDSAVWRRFCAWFGVPLYRYCYWLTAGSATLADDLRQETLLAAIDAIRRYRGEVPLFAWLCAIARHKAADELRRQGRQVSLEAAGDLADAAASPETGVAASQRSAAVIETLWSLPADYRTALTVRYLDGQDVESVAARLGRSYKAAESLLSRARKAFFERYGKVRGHAEQSHASR